MNGDILIGDCRESLRSLPAGSVHTCVTSPPYFGLRSYDEKAMRIDPKLSEDKKNWLLSELKARGVHAAR